ncbi:putative Ap4A phosphorylase II [Paratrimastix pyriformis]|uniref:Ap4A phosphorylase II n=1 Tax=Paratrimastix pyriformis TaxID=342808 RepID=A0ABQ8URV1_9EUKA|nr:putative Ap4A phosphorylase II [Paratrimastix pyriformis]
MEFLEKVTARYRRAVSIGKLHSMPSEQEFIEDQGVKFNTIVLDPMQLDVLNQKKSTFSPQASVRDPFNPPDQDLVIEDFGDSHIFVLNKFSLVPNHLLIVTREAEQQKCHLSLRDFEAAHLAMTSLPGLLFYNCGPNSGASQIHKHMQLIPHPHTPLDDCFTESCTTIAPYQRVIHACAVFPPETSAAERFARYQTLLEQVTQRVRDAYPHSSATCTCTPEAQLPPSESHPGTVPSPSDPMSPVASPPPRSPTPMSAFSYNFLMTATWMLVVPRRFEKFTYSRRTHMCGCPCPCPCSLGCSCRCSCTLARRLRDEEAPAANPDPTEDLDRAHHHEHDIDMDHEEAFPFNSLAFAGFLFTRGGRSFADLARLTPLEVLSTLAYPVKE